MLNRSVTLNITRAVTIVTAIAAIAQLAFEPRSLWFRVNSPIFRTLAAAGYLAGFLYANKMPREFPIGSGMRRAWRWITSGIASLLIYQSVDAFNIAFPSRRNAFTLDVFDSGLTISFYLLVVGLFGMWRTFRSAGLIHPLTSTDWTLVAAVAGIVIARSVHGDGTPSTAYIPLVWNIRLLTPFVIGAAMVVCFLLYRATVAFGQGRFSRALRGILLFFGIHILFLQLDWVPYIWDIPIVDAATDATYYVLPWLLAVALANCWSIPVSAAKIADRYASADSISELELETVGDYL